MFLLALAQHGWLQFAVSLWILVEAERNILAKLSFAAYERYQTLLHTLPLQLAAVPEPDVLRRYAEIVGDKDAHVVAAAEACGAMFLLSLDQRLIARIGQGTFSCQALTPKAFITEVLPTHREYPGR